MKIEIIAPVNNYLGFMIPWRAGRIPQLADRDPLANSSNRDNTRVIWRATRLGWSQREDAVHYREPALVSMVIKMPDISNAIHYTKKCSAFKSIAKLIRDYLAVGFVYI